MQPNFPGGVADGSVDKNPPDSAGDVGSIPELGRSPGEGNGNPLQYSCLGNPMDGGVWRATVHGLSSVGQDSPTQQQTIQPFWITADTCLTSTLTACQLQLQFFINNSCK